MWYAHRPRKDYWENNKTRRAMGGKSCFPLVWHSVAGGFSVSRLEKATCDWLLCMTWLPLLSSEWFVFRQLIQMGVCGARKRKNQRQKLNVSAIRAKADWIFLSCIFWVRDSWTVSETTRTPAQWAEFKSEIISQLTTSLARWHGEETVVSH